MKIEFKNITSNTNPPDGTKWKVTTKKREYTIRISYYYNITGRAKNVYPFTL